MNAMILYEESDCAKQASALLERASDRADAATRWNVRPWRLTMLHWPPLAQQALKDAAEAHLIVLAVRRMAESPPWLLNWLEVWAARREVPEAALAVFDGGNGDQLSASATPELSAFAQRHGLSFIFGDVAPSDEEPALLVPSLREREEAGTGPLLASWEPPPSDHYWGRGIND